MDINTSRLWHRIGNLSRITDPDQPWTRRSFSRLFLDGRRWLASEFRAAGLEPLIDAGGNLVATLEGRDPNLKPIVIGSHSDTVPSGGRYDGILGVLAALEVAQSLIESGERLRHSLQVYDFLAEEPTEFGLSCIGSRSLAGALSSDMLDLIRPDGMTLREGLRLVGGDPDNLNLVRRPPNSIAAFVEVHIEQGRVLENEGIRIGIVTDIVGIHRERIMVTGRTDHAGATPMWLRADALVGASRIIEETYRRALAASTETKPFVATIGRIEVAPNAVNAVPGKVEMNIETRSGDEEAIATFADGLVRDLTPPLKKMNLTIVREQISHVSPTPCSNVVRETIRAAAAGLGLSARDLPSGAGHDGVFISRIGPIGMIFVPCRDGRSHAPEESIEPHEAADGTRVLADVVGRLDATCR